jgi:hypothetical protein
VQDWGIDHNHVVLPCMSVAQMSEQQQQQEQEQERLV